MLTHVCVKECVCVCIITNNRDQAGYNIHNNCYKHRYVVMYINNY